MSNPSAAATERRSGSSPAAPPTTTVGVIVPCYNYARYLGNAVRSILDQEGVSVSVLVIDDSSTDDTPAVAEALAESDPRVEVIRHPANRGHIPTYNEGLEWASGDYVALLSADDVLAPGALARAAAVLDAHPNVGLAYGRAVYFSDVVPQPRAHPGRYHVWTGRGWLESRCRMGRIQLISPEAVVRTEVQHAVGGYRQELPHSGDNEMWMRIAHHADIAFISADQAFYRVHGANMSATRFGSPVTDAQHRKAAFDTALAEDPDLHRLAMRSLARDILWQACRAFDTGESGHVPVDEMVRVATGLLADGDQPAELWAIRWRRLLGPSAARVVAIPLTPAFVPRRLRRLRLEYGREWMRNLR